MNEIMNIGGVECYEKGGTVFLKLEAVARGLGFTKTDVKVSETGFRKEYVRIDWPRVEKYLAELGFSHKWSKDDFIPENIFYRLAMKAKNEVAEKFQAKVADEIIPSIRKHGAYLTPQTLEQMISSPEFGIKLLTALKEERDKSARLEEKLAVSEQMVAEMEPKASYYDKVLQTTNALPITLISKDYGMSAREMNRILSELGVQYKCGNTWVLYQEYAQMGYTKTYTIYKGDYAAGMHTNWTQKGRLFLYELLKREGILPLMEREDQSGVKVKAKKTKEGPSVVA